MDKSPIKEAIAEALTSERLQSLAFDLIRELAKEIDILRARLDELEKGE